MTVATDTTYETVRIERDRGITFIILNRPEKRNAMNPPLHRDMVQVLKDLEFDDQTRVLVLTGAGNSWCAGQDLRETFRALDNKPRERRRNSNNSHEWRWKKLYTYPKPTIAMVNGFCFGGGLTPLIACDFAIAAEEATFGLSEINWGIFPGGMVTKVVADALSYRDALYYIMTGDPFDGKRAAEMGLVNKAVPLAQLRAETVALAQKLMTKNPHAMRACKEAYKTVRFGNYEQAEEYLGVKSAALRATDPERGRDNGIKQFLDDKTYRPGFGEYDRRAAE
ncbi:MAG: p-hydroxycinnamoyl CoA hydratase/lyase [Chloroflexi bacterium]|nr:p-hydroxycinnamoyl CoA hydratase/lyase [Chloroflexota bacterium]